MSSTIKTRGVSQTEGLIPFAMAISEKPTELMNWLAMADWLQEQGKIQEDAFIRFLLTGHNPVIGEVSRGFFRYENGGKHWIGVTVSFDGTIWNNHYWSNGCAREEVTRERAVELIMTAGQPWKIERRAEWTGEMIRSAGIHKFYELTVKAS